MGIINLSPDSFSADGLEPNSALEQALAFVEQGADIIDIGAESTRPGASPISPAVEQSRLVPIINRLVGKLNVPISVDCYKYDVAHACLEAGAHIINDIWGLQYDTKLAELATEYNAPIILTSNQRGQDCVGDIMHIVKTDLSRAIAICRQAKVPTENIIVDPGIGFGKTLEQNFQILRRLDELAELGYPILLGTSRKEFIGNILGLPTAQRLAGTATTNSIGIAKGADIIRVHDVQFMAQVAKMSDILVRVPNDER